MPTQLSSLLALGNLLAFAEALVILVVAKKLSETTKIFSKGRATRIESLYFFMGAAAYFLYKLSYFLFTYYGIPQEPMVLRLFPNAILLAAGILTLRGAHVLAKYAGGKHG